MKHAPGIHMTMPVNIYVRNSDVIEPFMETNRERFEETEGFLESE